MSTDLNLKSEKILVAGGGGFIGGALVTHLVKTGVTDTVVANGKPFD